MDVLRPGPACVGIIGTVLIGRQSAARAIEAELGRQHDLVARSSVPDELADEFFADAAGVNIRRVHEVATRFADGIKDRAGPSLIDAPVARAKGRGAEAERADDQIGSAEGAVA